jgi:hypothetical protein
MAMLPGGHATAVEGRVSLYLSNMSDKAIDIQFGFSVNDENGKQVYVDRSATPHNFAPVGNRSSLGFTNFAKRSKLMRSLVKGTLIIEVHMRLSVPTKSVPPPFIPENPLTKMIQGLFLDEKSSDIIFDVAEGKEKNSATKVAKTAPVSFSAHRLIVENCSSIYLLNCVNHTMIVQP